MAPDLSGGILHFEARRVLVFPPWTTHAQGKTQFICDLVFDTTLTAALCHASLRSNLSSSTETRLNKAPPARSLGEHENALFAKWLSSRRDKQKRAIVAEQKPDEAARSRPATR
jgi:hypothetical protein